MGWNLVDSGHLTHPVDQGQDQYLGIQIWMVRLCPVEETRCLRYVSLNIFGTVCCIHHPKEKAEKEKVTQFLCLFCFFVSWVEVVNHKTFRMPSPRYPCEANPISDRSVFERPAPGQSSCRQPLLLPWHRGPYQWEHVDSSDDTWISKSPNNIRESHGSQLRNHIQS